MDFITGDPEKTTQYAMRYAWLRHHPSFEKEAFLAGITPEEFDAAVDKAMAADMPSAV